MRADPSPHKPPAHKGGIYPEAEAFFGIWLGRLTGILAVFGGIVLTGVMIVAVVSIIGRYGSRTGLPGLTQLGPVPGDFEIVSMGAGIAIFCFLAWAQFNRGHITVDVFVSRLSPRALAGLAAAGNLLLTALAVILVQQLQIGLEEKRRFGETTAILQLPIWWSYAGGMVGLWSFAIVSGYTVWRSLNEMLGAGEEDGNLP
ncbi:TRAP transporter small permease [Pararhodobacter sp. SW119]|uniref:TRAP transporter small permease n=1 Tax=Pararhodobacter sp. SW119 TaxID=2780075 RepID=UPI001ADF8C03|nr:TRAP transporter small permease [Pararhodobacter sp. SW119]